MRKKGMIVALAMMAILLPTMPTAVMASEVKQRKNYVRAAITYIII